MIFHTAELSGRERYQLLTSLVVPRPIAWVSTRSEASAPKLALFSYFAALSSSPFLVVIGEVLLVRLADAAPRVPGKHFVDSVALHPVGRLWGDWYSLLGVTRSLPRPPA